jgi:hypothetical protein
MDTTYTKQEYINGILVILSAYLSNPQNIPKNKIQNKLANEILNHEILINKSLKGKFSDLIKIVKGFVDTDDNLLYQLQKINTKM